MTLFAAPEPAEPEPASEPSAARCRRCRRVLTDEVSLGYRIGPDCREHLGIAPSRRVVRLARVRRAEVSDDQGDLLDEPGAEEVLRE